MTKTRPPKPEFLTVVAGPTDSIGDVSRRAVKLADSKQCPVHFTFQGIHVEALPDEDVWDPANRWLKAEKARKKPSPLESMLRIKLGTDPGVEECQS